MKYYILICCYSLAQTKIYNFFFTNECLSSFCVHETVSLGHHSHSTCTNIIFLAICGRYAFFYFSLIIFSIDLKTHLVSFSIL
jgi:hypothetical protein